MEIDFTNVGDTWNKKHKVEGPFTKEEMHDAKMYGLHSGVLFSKALDADLSQNAFALIHTLLLKHPNERVITYKEFYSIRYLKDKPHPFGPKLRRELEEKGFILSHENMGKVGGHSNAVGDICEFTFITEAFPCE